jgi:hypothetical protein
LEPRKFKPGAIAHQVTGDVLARIGWPPKEGVFLAQNEVAHLCRRLITEASRPANIKSLTPCLIA